MAEPLSERVERLLGMFAREQGFTIRADGDQTSEFGAVVTLESDRFVVSVVRDRGQESTWVGLPKCKRFTCHHPRSRPPVLLAILQRREPFGLAEGAGHGVAAGKAGGVDDLADREVGLGQ